MISSRSDLQHSPRSLLSAAAGASTPTWPGAALVFLLLAGCDDGMAPEMEYEVASARSALTVGGCACPSSGGCSTVSYSDIPSDHLYYVTTFGGGSDTQGMSCGGTADGTWAYVADKARFGCGTKLRIEANGKACIAKVADCGPNRCVEQAVSGSCSTHHPILDVSPYITKHLFGSGGVGWSDKKTAKATVAPASAPLGCPAPAPPPPPPSPPPPPPPPVAPDRGAPVKRDQGQPLQPDQRAALEEDGAAAPPPPETKPGHPSGGEGGCAMTALPPDASPLALLLPGLALLARRRRPR